MLLLPKDNDRKTNGATTMPEGTQVLIGGVPYKIGSHNFPFYYNNGGWVRSDKTADEIYDAIEKGEE